MILISTVWVKKKSKNLVFVTLVVLFRFIFHFFDSLSGYCTVPKDFYFLDQRARTHWQKIEKSLIPIRIYFETQRNLNKFLFIVTVKNPLIFPLNKRLSTSVSGNHFLHDSSGKMSEGGLAERSNSEGHALPTRWRDLRISVFTGGRSRVQGRKWRIWQSPRLLLLRRSYGTKAYCTLHCRRRRLSGMSIVFFYVVTRSVGIKYFDRRCQFTIACHIQLGAVIRGVAFVWKSFRDALHSWVATLEKYPLIWLLYTFANSIILFRCNSLLLIIFLEIKWIIRQWIDIQFITIEILQASQCIENVGFICMLSTIITSTKYRYISTCQVKILYTISFGYAIQDLPVGITIRNLCNEFPWYSYLDSLWNW